MPAKKKTTKSKKPTGKHPGGRPSPYKQEYCKQAEKLCHLGATDKQIADFFGVAESTINKWKIDHKEFSESLKKGKIWADANVANSLYQRANGFEHDSEEIKVVPGGRQRSTADGAESDEQDAETAANGDHPAIVRVPIRKVYPPDPTSMIFWLKNRQPKLWRDKVEQGFTNGDGEDVPPPITVFKIPDNGRDKGNTAATGVPDEGPEQPG